MCRFVKRNIKNIINILFTLFVVLVFTNYNTDYKTVMGPNSVISIIFFIFVFFIFKKSSEKANSRTIKYTISLALFFSAATILGKKITEQGHVLFKSWDLYLELIACIIFFNALLILLWDFLDKYNDKRETSLSNKKYRAIQIYFSHKYSLLFIMIFIFTCWIPYFLASYPGFFVYDATEQYQEAITGISSIFPPLHTLLLGKTVYFVYVVTGSYNAGIAVYTIIQMLFLAFCFSCVIKHMVKLQINIRYLILALVYYSFFPLIPMYSACSVRDTLFYALVLLFCIQLSEIIKDSSVFFKSKGKIAKLIITAIIMLLLRNGAVYLFILLSPFIIYKLKRFKYAIGTILLLIIISNIFIVGPVYNVLNLKKASSSKEFLSVPMQQIARVYVTENAEIAEQERNKLSKYVDLKSLGAYRAKVSDPIKKSFHSMEDPLDFFSAWASIGARYPGIYLDAFLANTVDAWYPPSVVNGYNLPDKYNNIYPPGGNCLFASITEAPGHQDSKFPAFLQILKMISYGNRVHKIPVVSLLFSPGFMLWFLLTAIVYSIKKSISMFVPLIFVLLIIIATFFGPIILIRYQLIMFFVFPVIISVMFCSKQFKIKIPEQKQF